MIILAILVFAGCWGSPHSFTSGQASGRSTSVGVPGLMPRGYYGPGGGMPYPVPMPMAQGPIGVFIQVIPSSPYNPRIDSPPFTMAPDFGSIEPKIKSMGPDRTIPKAKEKTLYERLGGEAAIKAVVDDFVARASADPKVNFTRKGTPAEWKPTPDGVEHAKKMLVELVGMATGGPQKYTGKNMREVHRGMMITQAEFDAAAADLKATLDKLRVPAKEQEELLKIVASTAPDVIEKKRN